MITAAATSLLLSICYFTPPKGWEIAEPEKSGSHVNISFFKKKKGFCPSINLASEKIPVSLDAYLKIVKDLHTSDRRTRWRSLGKIPTAAGEAELTEIDTENQWGPVRMLQMIMLKDKTAYILTAAASKKDFSHYYKTFEESFASLTLKEDLISAVPEVERQEKLKENLHDAKALEKLLIKEFGDMGLHWQILMLQSSLN